MSFGVNKTPINLTIHTDMYIYMLYIYAHTCDFIQNSHTLQSNNFTPGILFLGLNAFRSKSGD